MANPVTCSEKRIRLGLVSVMAPQGLVYIPDDTLRMSLPYLVHEK